MQFFHFSLIFCFLSMFYQASLPTKGGCSTITLRGLSVGFAKVTATHSYSNIEIQDSIYIQVYNPVKV